MKVHASLLFALVVCAAACNPATVAPVPDAATAPTFAPLPCSVMLRAPAGATRECGTVTVPLRRTASALPSETLALYVERVRTGDGPRLVYLTGGPGVGVDAYAGIGVFDKLLAAVRGEIVLIEQRGNARSAGRLVCAPETAPDVCIVSLESAGASPDAYNSVESAADIADVLDAIGAEQAVVWGHSYGSGLAQFFVNSFPTRVSALVLEGVSDPITPRSADPITSRLNALRSFGVWFNARCSSDAACSARYPAGIRPDEAVMTLLGGPPPTIALTETVSLGPTNLEQWFLNGLASYRGMLTFAQLVDAASRSTATDRAPMTAWLTAVGGGDPEAGARTVRRLIDEVIASTSVISNSVKSCFDLQSFGIDPTCDGLARDDYPATRFTLPLNSSTPTLFLNGVLDTQTLTDETDLVRPRFSQRLEVTLPACIGHFSFLDGGSCSDAIVSAFVSTQSVAVDVSCATPSVCDAMPLLP